MRLTALVAIFGLIPAILLSVPLTIVLIILVRDLIATPSLFSLVASLFAIAGFGGIISLFGIVAGDDATDHRRGLVAGILSCCFFSAYYVSLGSEPTSVSIAGFLTSPLFIIVASPVLVASLLLLLSSSRAVFGSGTFDPP